MIAYLQLLRPHQWLKNLMLLFPPFLGGTILQPGILPSAALSLLAFCLASSATYVFNDIVDAKNDLHHPRKKLRPISAGKIGKGAAAACSAALLAGGIVLGSAVSLQFLYLLFAYVAISVSYSVGLKTQPIIDLFCISAGFVLRLHAGGVAFGVDISDWLFLSVFLLSIFLSTGKRLSERNSLGIDSGQHRQSLEYYPPGLLEGTMYMTAAAVLVTYTMYVINRPALVYTVPLCTFGLLRFMLLAKSRHADPTDSLLKDPPLFVVGSLWAILIGFNVYGH